MRKKENEIEVTITCNNEEQMKAIAEAVRDIIIKKPQDIEKDDSDEPEPKAFQPKEGDICTRVNGDSIEAIFRYSGKTRTDEDGDVWIDGNPGLTYSEDLLKPYLVIYGEGAEFFRDDCRPATEEEIKLFNAKVKEYENHKDTAWQPEKDEEYWSPAREHFIDCVFTPGKVEWIGDDVDCQLLKKGWVFRTKEECQPLCDKLNEAIKNVKP